jgi:putative endonuclease
MTTKLGGNKGEDFATELLTAAGYTIVDRNAIIGNVEVDIIAEGQNRIIMVEVKTREEGTLDPNYGIDDAKLRRLSRAADVYVRMKNLPHEAQIDVILVTNHADGSADAEHMPDVYLPPMRGRRR